MREGEFKNEITKTEPISWRIEDLIGNFVLSEDESGAVRIEVANTKGNKFVVNDLLPEGYKITGNIQRSIRSEQLGQEDETTYGNVPSKEVIVSARDAKRERWQYLLTLLHEIGHMDRAVQKPEEVNRLLSLYNERLSGIPHDKESFEESHVLMSRDERDSWAFAIRHFRKIARELNLPLYNIFPDNDSIKIYIREKLLTYKDSGNRVAQFIEMSDEEREKLLDTLSQLYVREGKN